jgi:hypothetical protein
MNFTPLACSTSSPKDYIKDYIIVLGGSTAPPPLLQEVSTGQPTLLPNSKPF